MHRKYDTALYAGRISRIRDLMPNACIAADVITGFPGEDDPEFERTVRFLESINVSYFHVFSYSKRDRTLAAKMEGILHPAMIKARSELLHLLSDKKKRAFYEANVGSRVQVLFESDNNDGYMHGFSENYLKVRTPFKPEFINTIREVVLGHPDEHFQFTDHQK
jgi:threonylcarbamoyladenosine tRNA methylthiotransferase MtaB